jgi:CheY-like chemotaxis protein
MDLHMPVMDGYEATGRIRRLPGGIAEIPIVAMTANAMEGDREKCLSAGMNDYISKPVTKNDLASLLSRWLPATAAPPAAPAVERPPDDEEQFVFALRAALERFNGNVKLLHDLVELFVAQAPQRLAALDGALESRDYQSAGLTAHSLKGGASYISANVVKNLAFALELAANAGDGAKAREIFDQLRVETQRLLAAVKDVRWDLVDES